MVGCKCLFSPHPPHALQPHPLTSLTRTSLTRKCLYPQQVWQMGDGGFPSIGTRYMLQPGHVDPTFNMYDWVVGVRDGVVEGVWPIIGRGPGQ